MARTTSTYIVCCAAVAATVSLCVATALAAPTIAGCPMQPANNVWNTPVDTLPVHPNSAQYITTIGAATGLHPDFGTVYQGAPIGIPYVVVPGTQPKVPVTFEYADESDAGPYPVPPNPPIEGGPNATGDRHILMVDKDNCKLYELFSAYPNPDGSWRAGSGAIYDLRSNALRPDGWTSADAAGLPILPGLVRYDEVAAGEVAHAIRFSAVQTRRAYVWPARHFASSRTGTQYPPMGQRFRLKASFDISTFTPQVQVILRAFKKYGIILADNGSNWYITGAPDSRWNDDVLVREMARVKGSDFEAVDISSLQISANSGEAKQACGNASADTDGDGVPDCVEVAQGSNPNVKDNDIFANSAASYRMFVMQQYRDLLRREASDAEITAGVNALTGGQSRAAYIEAMLRAPGYQDLAGPITRLYSAYFLRAPELGGYDFWVGEYQKQNPWTFIGISNYFVISAEFKQRYGPLTNDQFVTLIYQNILGRAPDAQGFAFWTAELNTGRRNAGQVMADFSESPENKTTSQPLVQVSAIYLAMLKQGSVDTAALVAWTPTIRAGGSIQSLIEQILARADYRARFLP